MAGGTVYTKQQIRDICNKAHEALLPVHLDGARIFNAATSLNTQVADLVDGCDSVMFCLSKGLAAPVGSMLVGSHSFIEKARASEGCWRRHAAGCVLARPDWLLWKDARKAGEDHENAKLLATL
jgi:threonine aldolase